MNKFLIGCAVSALATSGAYAQSTGSDTIENNDAIVVTGSRLSNGVGGVVIPDIGKTRTVLTQEFLSHQGAGNTFFNALNQIPGVNFTNTDPYGSSGGNLRIRGFPGNRVALLWDGLPLNDTGNYSIYTNQQGDPEIIDSVSVNLGTTDVDSPTPSSAGGIVSYRTIVPTDKFGALFDGSIGKFDYSRFFGMINTGTLTSFGTKAFFSYSQQHYNKFTGAAGDLYKNQFNARIYQPIGTNGDFVSVAGHYNRNRNASYNNGLASDFATNKNFDNIDSCTLSTPGRGTVQNDNVLTAAGGANNLANTGSCTNYYGLRINPSNTANIRGSSRFTLAPGLIFTFDPGYQYTLANGGGTNVVSETDLRLRGANLAAGVDLNRDGDFSDSIRLYNPSNTRTNRYTALTSLIYELNDSNRVRVAYSYDRGEHRQTAEWGYLDAGGNPYSVFGGKYDEQSRVLNADGTVFQNRDRESVALLNQVSGEYFGRFLEDKIQLTLGLRAPFFERNLDQNCFTQVSTGNVTCGARTSLPATAVVVPTDFTNATGATAPATNYYAPFQRTVKYSPLLPSANVVLNISGPHSIYASYGRNFSAPSTDNLYRSATVTPEGETTDSFEGGYRYRSTKVQASLSGYYTDYKNRIVSALDADPESPTFGTSIDRNVGDARAYGFEGIIAVQPIQQLSFSPFISYINTRIKDDVLGANGAILLRTGGAQFVETPKWSFGTRADVDLGYITFGAQYKHTGSRYSTDDNGRTLVTTAANGQTVGQPFVLTGLGNAPISANGKVDAYDTLDLDARISLAPLGFEQTFLSLRVDNVFNEYYFGNISTAATLSNSPRFRIGSPRTWQAQIRFAF
ncbi:TonB-dependent receptor [Sphingomonas arantia]|uniref:TonB-dependent receptor n=1 Tax=Sphingomonas arantia TaxID=1460676 RepID=A0ABW4TU25_9SPHN